MPDIVDAGTVYNTKILARTGVLAGGLPAVGVAPKAVGSMMKQGAWNWSQADAYGQNQLEIDVAMWYGAMASPGAVGAHGLIRNCFHLLYYGSMAVKGQDGAWKTWRSLNWPIAMALSHGGRVLVQLPTEPNMPGMTNANFWTWLWDYKTPRARAAATHGINRDTDPNEQLPNGRYLHMKEVGGKLAAFKTSSGGAHYGIEIALGGAGNANPYSGKAVAPNGASGHLYLYYLPPAANKYGGLLIGCEGSAPPDRKQAKHDDQFGGGHSIFGGSNTFSGTGGLKFGGAKLKDPVTGTKTKVAWQDKLSGSKGSMVIDLITNAGAVAAIMSQPAFQAAWLGSTG